MDHRVVTPSVILSACRTPIGSFGGVFKDLTAANLGAIAIREAIARGGLDPKDVGDVIMGCVLQAGAGMNVARQAALDAGVPVEGPTCAINGCHMGNTAEEVARRYAVSRADQDAFAAESQRRAEAAVTGGAFDREIVPVDVPSKKGAPVKVTRDEYPRAG